MSTKHTTALIFIFLVFINFSQNIWTAVGKGESTGETMDLLIDNEGNNYITGYISGKTNFQGISYIAPLGYCDMFLAKLDAQGKYLWVKMFGGSLADKGLKLALNSKGQVLVAGTYYTSITFGNINLTAQAASKDIFMALFDQDGEVLWARSDGGEMGDNPYGLTFDSKDNIIMTGQFQGNATIGNQSFTSTIDPDLGTPSFDLFLAKYDQNGIPLWAKVSSAPYEDRGLAVVCDASDDIYMTGQFSKNIDFFGTPYTNSVYNVGFVAKLDKNGFPIWFDKLLATQVLAYDLTLNSTGKVIVTGDFIGQLTVYSDDGNTSLTNPYKYKIFVLQLDQNGKYIWAKANGSNSEVSSHSVCTDQSDNIYIGGTFKCNFDQYRDSSATAFWQSVGFRDLFVSKFNTTGTQLWKNQVGGPKDDFCWGIAVKDEDYPIIGGSYSFNLNFPFKKAYDYNTNLSNKTVQAYNATYDIRPDKVNILVVEGENITTPYIAKMLSSNSEYYNYYNSEVSSSSNSDSDSMAMFIYPLTDTVHLCPDYRVYFRTNTMKKIGPMYDGVWNNGLDWTTKMSPTEVDGKYSLTVTREDQCYAKTDEIYIDYHPTPQLPSLTDDHGVNVATKNYKTVSDCAPDTLRYTFTDICQGCNARFSINGASSVSIVSGKTYEVSKSADFFVSITSEFGCNNYTDDFKYILSEPIVPELLLADSYDHNDSMQVCSDDYIYIYIIDTIANPERKFISQGSNVVSMQTTYTFNGNTYNAGRNYDNLIYIAPKSTPGWYYVHTNIVVGDANCLQSFSIADSFYVEPVKAPVITAIGATDLCPNQDNYLSIDNTGLSNIHWWSNPILIWTSSDKDSVRITGAGTLQVSVQKAYQQTTCDSYKSFVVKEKKPPIIYTTPSDGIVCPNDSVLIYLNKTGQSYEWLGPEGTVISTNASVYGIEQGYYACIFVDDEGCRMITNHAEIKEYTSPFVDLAGDKILCNNDTVQLKVVAAGESGIWWSAPINSAELNVGVTEPGTYICRVSQCGITVEDTVEVIDGRFNVTLTTEKNELCYGDSTIMQATSGLTNYQWSNSASSESYIYAKDSGNYWVSMVNQFGCIDSSNVITIKVHLESYPPTIANVSICEGADLVIKHLSPFDLQWYTTADQSTLLSTEDSIIYSNLTTDFTVYAAYQNAICPLVFKEIIIDVIPKLTTPNLFGDSILCEGQELKLWADSMPNATVSWTSNGNILSNTYEYLDLDFGTGSPTNFTFSADDGCSTAEKSISIDLKFQEPFTLPFLTDTLCYGESLQINPNGLGNVMYHWTDGINTWGEIQLDLNFGELSSSQIEVYGVSEFGCISDTQNVHLYLSQKPNFNLTLSASACTNQSVTIFADSTLSNISWTKPNGISVLANQIIISEVTAAEAGYYLAHYTDSLACNYLDSLLLSPIDLPIFHLGNDTVLCFEDAFNLFVPNMNCTFVWNNLDSTAIYSPNGKGPVVLTAINEFGCIWSDTINIHFVPCSGVGANIVTANGDGINDYVTIFDAQFMTGNYIRIFNRWGNIVFEQNNYRNDFSPIDMAEGVYFYEFYPDGLGGRRVVGYFQLITH